MVQISLEILVSAGPYAKMGLMNRRLFVFRLAALSATLGVGSLLSALAKSTQHHVCLVEVEFQKNQSLETFKKDRSRWMNFEEYESVVADFERKGLLLRKERTIHPSSIQVAYHFKDKQSHDHFVRTIHNAGTVGEQKMQEIGYRFNRRYYQA